jgi:hypothetical protein
MLTWNGLEINRLTSVIFDQEKKLKSKVETAFYSFANKSIFIF